MIENFLGEALFEQNAVNVLLFGAIGDGVADDTESLQNAINSKRENGGAIYFPALTYKVTKPLVFYSNQLLFFEPGAAIKQGASIDALLLSDGGVAQGGYDGVHDSVIVGATFDGADYETNMSLVGICHSRNIKFINCIFKNAYGTYHNIEINSSFGTVIDGCDFEGSRKTGASAELIQIDAALNAVVYPWPTKNDGTVCENIEIKSCVFHDDSISPAIGNHTAAVHKCISIHDCYFEGFGAYGTIRFDGGGENIDIYNNTFVNCVTGVATSGATYYIRNNRFIGATTAIAGTASVAHANMINGSYSQPAGSIQKTDLAQAVQTSLGKADSALQSVPSTYRTAAAQDSIDAAQDTAIAGKLPATGNAYRSASIPMGHLDSTSTATVMTAQVDGITELRDGVCMWLQNGVITSASGFTLNVNGLGAKPCYSSLAAASRSTTIFNVNYTMLFVYNEDRVEGGCWDIVYGVDTNTTYTPYSLGFGYGTCTTAADTAAKVASVSSSYKLVAGGIVAIKFSSDVPANATLNINSKGAKAIYYKGAAITAGVIRGGNTVTMIYSTYYHVLSIDRAIPQPSDEDPAIVSDYASPGSSTEYARADHHHNIDASGLSIVLEGVPAQNIGVILYNEATNGVTIQAAPSYLAGIFVSQVKINFALVIPPDTENYPVLFTASKFDANTGELHLTGIVSGVLYEATLFPGLDPIDNDGIAMVGTMATTNLVQP